MAVIAIPAQAPGGIVRAASGGRTLFHLQALRGIAASLVVLAHAMDALAQHGRMPQQLADRLANSGYFGVVTFFVVSGFIIYKTSRQSAGSLRGVNVFVLKRLIRIFPVYWIATAGFVLLSPHRASYTIGDIVFSLLLVPYAPSDGGGDMHPLLGQGWTLQYEILFYMIFAAGLLLSSRIGTLLILAALGALVALGAVLLPLSGTVEPTTILTYWTRPIILLFAVGIGLGILHERFGRQFDMPYPFLLMLAVLGAWFAYSLMAPLEAAGLIRFPTAMVIWLLAGVWTFVSIFGRRGEGLFESVAEAFGDASYSVYLFHTFILSALLRLRLDSIDPVLFIITALTVSNVFGYLMYRLVEKPILRRFRGVLRVA